MRRVRIVISGIGTAMPTLVAVVLPAIDACGSGGNISDASTDGTVQDAKKDTSSSDGFVFPDSNPPQDAQSEPKPCNECQFTIPVPEAGVFPDLASVCAASTPVQSNTAATITLSNWNGNALTADGFIAITSDLLNALVGDPVITGGNMTVQQLTKTTNGYTFKASQLLSTSMTLKVTLQVACGDAGLDGGVQTVESTTDLALCIVGNADAWESSGSTCIQCCVVCEMAPTPITSDNTGDDLPLARALRLRVIELARAGNQVVLFAQNDAGEEAEYEWHVTGGTFEKIAADVIVWTLPDTREKQPFGQLALWNDEGAIVENFYWGAA
jgi:hypothetical protein